MREKLRERKRVGEGVEGGRAHARTHTKQKQKNCDHCGSNLQQKPTAHFHDDRGNYVTNGRYVRYPSVGLIRHARTNARTDTHTHTHTYTHARARAHILQRSATIVKAIYYVQQNLVAQPVPR